jgi:hypothetical protein
VLERDTDHPEQETSIRSNQQLVSFICAGLLLSGLATQSLAHELDRSTGAGRGWLFKFDAAGQLLGKLELTDGTKYIRAASTTMAGTSGFLSPSTGRTAGRSSIASIRQ